MRLTQNVKGISKLILLLLLLVSFIIGALFSYVYTMGFYAPSEFKIPERSVITIESVEFSEQDTSFFNVTVLNPSYSPTSANITRIVVRTTDDNKVHRISDISPSLPYLLNQGFSQTFRCNWNWANYTGIKPSFLKVDVVVSVFLEDNTGAVFEKEKPFVALFLSEVRFDSSVSVNYFNITVENVQSSVTYVNITSIRVDVATITHDMVTPSLPYGLAPGDPAVTFKIMWNWTDYQGKGVTVSVHTQQGYMGEHTLILPQPVNLTITDVAFNVSDTTHFNVTVANSQFSPAYVNISEIMLSVDNEPPVNITEWIAYPSSKLESNSSVLLVCTWDWNSYRGQNIQVKVFTQQGFVVSKSATIP